MFNFITYFKIKLNFELNRITRLELFYFYFIRVKF